MLATTGAYSIVSQTCGKSTLDGYNIMVDYQNLYSEYEWDFYV